MSGALHDGIRYDTMRFDTKRTIGNEVYYAQCCADGSVGALRSPMISNLQGSWSKASQAAKRVDHSIFCDLFLSNNLVTIVGQLVGTPPPNKRCLGTSLTALTAMI